MTSQRQHSKLAYKRRHKFIYVKERVPRRPRRFRRKLMAARSRPSIKRRRLKSKPKILGSPRSVRQLRAETTFNKRQYRQHCWRQNHEKKLWLQADWREPLSIKVKIWDYRRQEAFRRAWRPRDVRVPFKHTPFIRQTFAFITKLNYLRKFLSYKNHSILYRKWLRHGHGSVAVIRRAYLRFLWTRTVLLRRLQTGLMLVNKQAQIRLNLLRSRQLRRLHLVEPLGPQGLVRRSVLAIPTIILASAFTSRVLKFNYQVKWVLLTSIYRSVERSFIEVGASPVLSTELLDRVAIARSQINQAKKNASSDWNNFWTKFRVFKWFFEYRRWRRSYQLAIWFRKLRNYRRIKKEAFYLRLLRLYFYYLGEISEDAIVQLWRKFRRLDNRYQFTGFRFFQMLQMRVSNLLVFMGLAANSVAGREASRLGLVRINGFSKSNSYALVMAGDLLQFNLDVAYDYLTLFSDLYWIKVETQSNFIGFLQVLFSMMLFMVLRWPRRYELSETDSRLNTRMLMQIIRLFPVRILQYTKVSNTRRVYDRHQNVVKMMPYKYRKSRRQIIPLSTAL